MRLSPLLSAVVIATLPMPALAEDVPPRRISVTGRGSVFTPPDLAVIEYSVHGEGATSDEAVAAMEKKRIAVDAGVRRLAAAESKGSEVTVREVRSRDCNASRYAAPSLNTGACAIMGYVADLSLEIRTTNVAGAATAAGLIGGLGGSDPHVSAYRLADPRPAQRRAMAAAFADAKVRAQAIAEGAGVTLGALYFASDVANGAMPEDIVVTAARAGAPPPPPAPPAPIAIGATPRLIETEVRTNVIYLIAP